MYVYVFDEFIQDKRYENELSRIENRLTDLGIAGKVIRLALFRNAEEMIRDEIDRGATTVVVVGNDVTVRKVLDVVVDREVVFGIIPLGPGNALAEVLGVPEGVAACDVLSGRIVETIDVGTINGKRFVTGVSVPRFNAEITCDEGRYRLSPTTPGDLEILNLSSGNVHAGEKAADPRDGKLDTIIRVSVRRGLFGKNVGESILPLSSMAIRSDAPMTAFADGEEMTGTRFDIGVEPAGFKVITGKERRF